MNLAGNLVATARRDGASPALRLGSRVVSHAALDDASRRVAGLLHSRGVQAGDRVAIMLPNVPEFAFAYYGVLRAGAVVVPMNVLLKQREVEYYLSDSGATLMFAWHECATEAGLGARRAGVECVVVDPEGLANGDLAEDSLVDRAPGDTAVILYTSGTTGVPKGAELTHANLCRNADATIELFGVSAGDVILGALPLFHSFGQTCALNVAVAAGASLTLVPRFDAGAVLELVERDRVTIFEGVPTMYSALLNDPRRERYDCSSLRVCVSGGAALPVEVLHGFEAAFDCVILEGYGLSETSPVACFNHRAGDRVPGSIGTPIAGVEMKLVDPNDEGVGEVAIRGHNVMKAYWKRPEATAEAIDAEGWFHTGDMGRMDEDGRFYIVDRKKDMIIRGGYNVYPREIEEILHEHPAVLEAAVIGVPHDSLGEEVAAAVAVRPGFGVTPDDLREHVREQIAAYKYPRHVWLVDELPKGPTGKILKREITAPGVEKGA